MAANSVFENVSIDDVRRYWDQRPCNIRHSPLPVGTREYFDQVEARKYFVEPHIPLFAQFDRWKDKRVLEVGCGIGTDTINFARAGAEVVACDLSSESIQIARQRADVFGLADRITFVNTNAETMEGVPDSSPFDLVYSFGVIHHSPHPGQILRSARALAGVGTSLKIMVYNRRSWKVAGIVLRAGAQFWRADELIAKESEAQTGCPVTYTYTKKSAHELVEPAGFRVDHLGVDHIFPYKVSQYVQYRYKKQLPFSLMPTSLTRALETRVGWHLLIDATAV